MFAGLFIVTSAIFSAVLGQENKPGIDALGWLSGCWEQKTRSKIKLAWNNG